MFYYFVLSSFHSNIPSLVSCLVGLLFLALFPPLLLAPNSAEILCPGDRTGNAVSGQEYVQGCRFCCPSQWSKLFYARPCSVECSAVFIIQVWTDTKTCQWESLQIPIYPPNQSGEGHIAQLACFWCCSCFWERPLVWGCTFNPPFISLPKAIWKSCPFFFPQQI